MIKLGFRREHWESGVKTPLFWNTETTPHILIAGLTGGSKTVTAQMIINQLLTERKSIYIADFKAGGDWNDIVPHYAEYKDCDQLLDEYYSRFTQTIQEKGRLERYLVFDEFSIYMLTKDTKAFKYYMDKISHIAFMGRSFGFHLIFIAQQFSAKVLDTAVREQFGIKIYMGSTISTESATMLFPNCEIDKSIHLPRYCGYASLPEKELDIMQIPYLSNPEKLKKLLIQKGISIKK